VLHTDEPHPHVHLALKAVSEQGVRTLRHWRSQFASHLRALGVAANATERAVRGESRSAKKDGIYRASLRGESRYMREHTETVAADLAAGRNVSAESRALLEVTRSDVVRGWGAIAKQLLAQGNQKLASNVVDFVRGMPPPTTGRDLIARALLDGVKMRQQVAQDPSR
jgi:hypothetical protein